MRKDYQEEKATVQAFIGIGHENHGDRQMTTRAHFSFVFDPYNPVKISVIGEPQDYRELARFFAKAADIKDEYLARQAIASAEAAE